MVAFNPLHSMYPELNGSISNVTPATTSLSSPSITDIESSHRLATYTVSNNSAISIAVG